MLKETYLILFLLIKTWLEFSPICEVLKRSKTNFWENLLYIKKPSSQSPKELSSTWYLAPSSLFLNTKLWCKGIKSDVNDGGQYQKWFLLCRGSILQSMSRNVAHTTFSLLQSINGTKQQHPTGNVKARHIPFPTLKEYIRRKEKQSKPRENDYNWHTADWVPL